MFVNPPGKSGVDTGDIPASLRFRNAASSYCNRLFGSPTSTTKWSFSTWVKLGNLGQRHFLLVGWNGASDRGYLEINDSGVLRYDDFYSSSQRCLKVSTPVYRDPTGWLHIVCEADTGNATAEDRLRIYVNGVRVTSWSTNTNYTVSTATQINWASHQHYIGWLNSMYGDDYRARTAFVDNGGGGPTDFIQFNTEINEWVSKSQSAVKAVVDAGGTNSFMLDFDDGTSLTTLGYDKSSKGNNWTLNNFSLTAGTTYDHMLDVPGNSFATLNPLKGTGGTLSNANMLLSSGAGHNASVVSQDLSSGKMYAEGYINATPTGAIIPGIGLRLAASANIASGEYTGSIAGSFGGICGPTNMTPYSGGVAGTALSATITSASTMQVAADFDAGKVWIGVDNSWIGGGSPSAGTLPTYTFTPGTAYTLYYSAYSIGVSCVAGQAPLHASATYHSAAGGYFRYAPPTGYKALCQRNMPDPAILNPEKHFDVVTRTGTAATYSVAGLGFQPDLVWVKSRGRAVDHALYDSVRGVQKQLESNQIGAETTESTGLTAFNSGGYTGGALDQINGTTATNSFVDWLWKAGGAAVTNNAGSISSQVSANVEAGFSIVTYTGTGANATVGHGLGKAPGLVIVKSRSFGGYSWTVYNQSLTAGYVLFMETTSAQTSRASAFNSTSPTSSVFSLGTDIGTNQNTSTFVAYCFAEIPGFSKIFSYTGNGAADGPFVHCGFKPKFILLKNASAAGNGWIIYDAVRNTYNIMDLYLQPNTSSAEGAAAYIDAVSNGFKVRTANADANGSTNTIVGIAFADVPAKYSLAR